jgi:di/tricarboxylate transporter
MSLDNILILAILGGALVLFISERLRVDVVALLVLSALILTDLVTIEEAFSGFASPAVVTVWSVFIISGALYRTGVADSLARAVLRLAGRDPLRLTVVIMVTVGVMSAFMNNIGAVAIMLPAVVSVAHNLRIPPSKLLIPLAFASLMGGNMTLIGTPPNILAAEILRNYGGLEPFSFFDFTPTGLIVLTAGVIYMAFIGRHILPERYSGSAPGDVERLRPYLTEIRIPRQSALVGKSVAESGLGERHDLNIIHIERGQDAPFFPSADRLLLADDVLLVEGRRDDILTACDVYTLFPNSADATHELDLTSGSAGLVEVTLSPGSEFIGQTLQRIQFRSRYDLSVLAIRHHGESLVSRLADVPLDFGDSLLVQGEQSKIELLRRDDNFLVLDSPPLDTRRLRKGPLALGILLTVLLAITLGWLHPSAAMLMGALAMVLTGILRMDEAYQAIEWKSVFLIAGILPLGVAMETTGTAALIAEQITGLLGGLGPRAVLIGIFILTALLTEVISNAAATVLVAPIAIDTALSLDASPYTFVLAVVIAASTSFLMPIGHQVNVLVFGPGGYRFSDYTKVGVWLNLIILLLVALVLPLIWPLFP